MKNIRLKQIGLSLFLLVLFSPLFGQDALKGVVMEETEKGKFSPLIGVNVYWKGTTMGTYTDTNGVFNIPDDHKNHMLIISYIGYETDTIEVSNHRKLMVVLKNARMIDKVEVIHRRKATSLSYMDPKHVEVLSEMELFKAACCNLSESFETNASVDASYTDAVSGIRQIQMLGLSGIYTQTITENLPTTRGLGTVYGLTYIPGAWIENISISKGSGSVINGYESITGQINTELRKPVQKEQFYFNAYGNQSGRMEGNVDYKIRLNEKWSTSFLLHGRALNQRNDRNSDGFMDMPLNRTFIGMNRWQYEGISGIHSQFGIKYIDIISGGGNKEYDFSESSSDQYFWGTQMTTRRLEGFAKTGYIFPQQKYNSIGLQVFALNHEHESFYGLRNYDGTERSLYGNLIFQTIVKNTNHKLKIGTSFLYDDYNEVLDTNAYNRIEEVPGLFGEYTLSLNARFTLVAGMRADHHNLYDWFYSPRLHLRYGLTENTVIRMSAGIGNRVANVIAENSGYLASSRKFVIPGREKAYGLNPERALNYGMSISQKFRLDYRDGNIVFDYFRTEFLDQVVVDLDQEAQAVHFYNLGTGKSFANSFQLEVSYEVIKRFDMKVAYRFYDVRTDYSRGLLEKALMARNKAFMNLAYETKYNERFSQWRIDGTAQFIGPQRIPYTESNPVYFRRSGYSDPYILLSAQVTKVFNDRFELYLGVENVLDYSQKDAIVSSTDPFGPYFDASMIWAPIFGRNIYAGLRYRVKQSAVHTDSK